MGLMKTTEDFENDEVMLIEYRWAYDGWLIFQVKKTGDRYHRSGYWIITQIQPEEYWPVYFRCEEDKYYKNLREITEKDYIDQVNYISWIPIK